MNNFGFGPVFKNEQIVFGAQRPGYNFKSVSISDLKMDFFYKEARGQAYLLPFSTKSVRGIIRRTS